MCMYVYTCMCIGLTPRSLSAAPWGIFLTALSLSFLLPLQEFRAVSHGPSLFCLSGCPEFDPTRPLCLSPYSSPPPIKLSVPSSKLLFVACTHHANFSSHQKSGSIRFTCPDLSALLRLILKRSGMKGKDIYTIFAVWLQILSAYLLSLSPHAAFLDEGPTLSFLLINPEGICDTFWYLCLCII